MSFSLTRKTDYALLALARLSQPDMALSKPRRSTPGSADLLPKPRQSESSSAALGSSASVSARLIAAEFDLPLPVLTNILKDLTIAGLIASRRGAGGGYHLQRPASQITLAEVVAAIEGPVALARCCDTPKTEDACPTCRVTPRCPITHTMHRFNDAITLAMRQLTLAQLMREDLKIALNIQPNTESQSPRSFPLAQTA
ncbi:MAG: Rrf2 family transcriptional regulator [Phycisphaeraceae bacterium]